MFHSKSAPECEFPIISAHFKVYIYQPKNDFYQLSFADRLKEVEDNIELAKENLKGFSKKGLIKAIFIAPEYLFKDLNKSGKEKYYSQEQKNQFKNTLIRLSQDSELILAPGTICWQKTSKENQKIYYRNMIYFVYKTQVMKYRKSNPHLVYDFDFSGGRLNQSVFFKKGSVANSNIIKLNGLHIGVEICLDNYKNQITNADEVSKIDAHVIVADKLPEVNLLPLSGILSIKVEREPKYQTFVGIQENKSFEVELHDAETINSLTPDLTSYTFLDFKLKNEPLKGYQPQKDTSINCLINN